MANHVLSLEVPTVMNPCILTIMDTSVYTDLIPVVCEQLNITVPGFQHSVQLDVNAGFIENITACDLNLQTSNCGVEFVDIPDGIYAVSVYHDENDNEKLDLIMGMIPKEDTGTSNNPKVKMGPPKWEESIFEVKEDMKDLQGSQELLEKFAREKYYFQKANEDVYVVVEESTEED